MRVLAFGSFDAARHPRVQVLLDGLRARGVDVDVCNVPLELDTADRVKVLAQPWRLPLLALTILGTWLRLARQARRSPRPDAVLVGYLGHFDVLLARLLFRRTPIVHDMLIFASDTARDRGAGGLKQALLRRLDAAAVAASDLVVVDTDEHLAMLPADRLGDGLVVPVGAPQGWLAPDPEPRPGPLRVVFFGLYTPLQGAPVIGEALALLPPDLVQVTMVGTGQDLARTRALAGPADVTWRDWVAPAELPALVAAHDVCLGIFAAEGKGTRVVPNKVFQGAAAGCAVVTSDTAPQRRALGDAAVLVPPGDPQALAKALLELAGDRDLLLRRRRAAHALARDAFLPQAVTGPLLDRLHSLTTRKAP
jgi:glycosyltransferase involved in cell wall biosynthesis